MCAERQETQSGGRLKSHQRHEITSVLSYFRGFPSRVPLVFGRPSFTCPMLHLVSGPCSSRPSLTRCVVESRSNAKKQPGTNNISMVPSRSSSDPKKAMTKVPPLSRRFDSPAKPGRTMGLQSRTTKPTNKQSASDSSEDDRESCAASGTKFDSSRTNPLIYCVRRPFFGR